MSDRHATAAHLTLFAGLLPALGLLVITLLAFAVISPLNSAGRDDWIYPFYGKLRSLTVFGTNREFGIVPAVITEILTPGRIAHGLFSFQLLSVFAAALALFYLLRRLLLNHAWFALAFAAIYILYIPNNGDQARTLYSASVSTWIVFLGAAAALLLVKSFDYRGWLRWLSLLTASFFAYMIIRAFEAAIPVLVMLPFLLFFIRHQLTLRRTILSLLIWYGFVGVGVLQFIQPFFSQSAATVYQATFTNRQPTTVLTILNDTLHFYATSFPIDKFFSLPAVEKNYLVPGILVGLACVILLILYRRLYSSEAYIPRPRLLLLLMLVGLIEIGLSTVAFAYAHIANTPRANFSAAPGQALVVLAVAGFAALILERLLSLRAVHLLTGFLFLYGVVGASWYNQAQNYAITNGPQWDTTLRFFREIVALVPNAPPDTLILYDCDASDVYEWRLIDAMAGIYLYDGVRIGVPDQITWLPDKMNYQFIDWLDPRSSYGYDQLIMIGCANGHLYVMDSFPAAYLPAAVRDVPYNPFARIVNGFIPPERGRILGY